ncbi:MULTISPECIES: hypothetical protein [Streptomyces]|uniref:hypothetical protein n=1 Tax=Streptomyces lycopersici TaxID=2974589 RepID=UPI0021CF57F8|nr:hypothetical protein [Streptomyces sp. NEAU-383]
MKRSLLFVLFYAMRRARGIVEMCLKAHIEARAESEQRATMVFAALAAHAVVVEVAVSAAEFDAVPLSAVAEAATGKRDIELLAGLPGTFADGHDGQVVDLFRLYAYQGAADLLQ